MPIAAEAAAGRRLALVVATGSYVDSTLAKLRAPGRDASDLAAVLEDAAVGGFEVEMVLDAPAELLRRRIAQFCAQTGPADLALVYLSCHGVLDDRGRLYYATVDTDRTLLSATAVSSAWLNEQLEDCRCRRQIVVLDCCHSGAFSRGAKGAGGLALGERFQGRGRVVLTGSRATEYSFERGRVVGDGVSSVFTSALVEGLRSGEADRDGDGMITVSEIYDYAYEAVRLREAHQTPTLWAYGAEGDLLFAHSPRGAVVKPAPLPEDLIALLESPRSRVREGAVTELADLLRGSDAGRALTARSRLERVAAEDVPSVAAAARAALDAAPVTAQPHPPLPSAPASSPPSSTARPPGSTSPPSRHRRLTVACAAGVIVAVVIAVTVALQAGGGQRASGPGKIALNGSPRGVAADAGVAWVTRYAFDLVERIGPSSHPVPIKVGHHPGKIVAGQGSVWVSVHDGRGLMRIDPTRQTAGKEVPFDLERCSCTIAELAIAQGRLWVGSANGIAKLDLRTGKSLGATYRVGPGFEGVFAVGPDALWAVENSSKPPAVIRIDLASGKPHSIPFPKGEELSGIAFGHKKVWVADAGENRNTVTALNPHENVLLKSVTIGSIANDDIAVTGAGVLVWDTWGGVLTRIDADMTRVESVPGISGYERSNKVNLEHSDLAVDGGFAWVTEPLGSAVYKVRTNRPS